MITIKKTNWGKIKKEWEMLCLANSQISPFQEYNLSEIIRKHYLFFTLSKAEIPLVYIFYKDEKPILIAPICKRQRNGKTEFVSFGACATIAFQDFIYSEDISYEDIHECLNLLLTKIKNIHLYNLPTFSKIYELISKYVAPVKSSVNVTISMGGGYDKYYQSLSKSVRQNIRTSYNRMKKDGIEYEVKCAEGVNIGKSILHDLMNLYIRRRNEKYGRLSPIHEWFLRHYHFNTIGMRTLKSSVFIYVRMNGEMAAFLAGYRDKNNKYLLVPRLAINSEFARYSPGNILINESVKILESELHLSYLDLSKGNDQYKFTMGGVEYNTFDFDLSSEDLIK